MSAEDDFFLMANLRPAETGLPMVVWVSERGSTTGSRPVVEDPPRAKGLPA
jgi:hypothetical protein